MNFILSYFLILLSLFSRANCQARLLQQKLGNLAENIRL